MQSKMTRKRSNQKQLTKVKRKGQVPNTFGVIRSSFTPSKPGVARLRGAFELFNGAKQLSMSYLDFGVWFTPARNILAPFMYFRIRDLSLNVATAGGTASPYTIVANVSNSVYIDTTATAILDDEYAGMANAATPLTLHPPQRYWDENQMRWYISIDPTAGIPTVGERSAGSLSFFGYGGATAGDVIGWAIVEATIEFHTQT